MLLLARTLCGSGILLCLTGMAPNEPVDQNVQQQNKSVRIVELHKILPVGKSQEFVMMQRECAPSREVCRLQNWTMIFAAAKYV